MRELLKVCFVSSHKCENLLIVIADVFFTLWIILFKTFKFIFLSSTDFNMEVSIRMQITEKKEAQGKGEKARYTHLNAEFQRIAKRDKKAFLSDQCKD